MKIFFFFSILHRLYCEVAKEFLREQPETQFSGILYGRDQLRDLQQRNFPSQELFVFADEVRRELSRAHEVIDSLSTWERRHGVSLSTILSTDRRYQTFPREEGLRIAAVTINLCEAWLDRIQPDAIVAEGIDDLLSHVLYYSARARGIPYLITYASPTPNRVAIYSNPDNHWERVEEGFFQLKNRSLTPEQRAQSASLVTEYRDKHLLPSYLKAGFTRLISGCDLHSLGRVVRKNWLDPARGLDPSWGGTLAAVVARKCKRFFRAVISPRQYFHQPHDGERFVFFPLQMEPECSTLVFAPFHANQHYVIECVSKSLPIDHFLYVKEHPAMLGRRPRSYYHALCSLPNVKLISPQVSSHSLILQAGAVVTITSSVGWEALMHAKPVIVLANVWYDACDLVRKLRATSELPAALKWMLEEYKPDEELLLKFVTAFLEGTYPGQIEHPDYCPAVLCRENAVAIANAIARHLDWLGFASAHGPSHASSMLKTVSSGEDHAPVVHQAASSFA